MPAQLHFLEYHNDGEFEKFFHLVPLNLANSKFRILSFHPIQGVEYRLSQLVDIRVPNLRQFAVDNSKSAEKHASH